MNQLQLSENQMAFINQEIKKEIGELTTAAIQYRTLLQGANMKIVELEAELEQYKPKEKEKTK